MNEFLVTNSHGRGRPAIVGLGSQFVVVWAEPGNQNLRGARFDASGNKLDEFQVNTTPGTFGLATVKRIQGGFVVAWVAFPPSKLVFQRFGPDGRKAGPEVVVSDNHVVADLERMRAPAVASLLDGNFVVSWAAAPSETLVRAAIFNGFDGGKVGSEFAVNSSAGFHFAPIAAGFGAAGLDDITFVIAWEGGVPGQPRSHFQMFNIDGSKAGPQVLPARQSIGEIAPAIFRPGVSDPREFISVLGGRDGNEGQRITADLFTRQGVSFGTNVTGVDTINFDPRVDPLPNGAAVVTWTQRPIPTTGLFGTRVMAAILGLVGGSPNSLQVISGIVPIGANNIGSQISASAMLDEFGNSRIAFTWVEQPEGSNDMIKARVLTASLN